MESLFVLWRVTGKALYQEWAWMIFRAFQAHARCSSGGYANLDSVLQVRRWILGFQGSGFLNPDQVRVSLTRQSFERARRASSRMSNLKCVGRGVLL